MSDPQHPRADDLLKLVKGYNNFQNRGDYWEFGYDVGTGWKKMGVVTAHHAQLLQELKTELEGHLSFDKIDAGQKSCPRIGLHPDHLKDSDAFVGAIRKIRDILCPEMDKSRGKFPPAVWNDKDEMWPLRLHLYCTTWLSTGFVCGLSPVFGIVTTGVHLNVYKGETKDPKAYSIFVAKRSDQKSTFRGKYDQCAAGGYQYAGGRFGKANDSSAKDCLKREVEEEINGSLLKWLGDVKEASPIQFAVLRDEKWGKDFLGAPELGVKIPFDLKVEEDPVFKPNTDEVESVKKKSVDEIVEDLLDLKFKPNSALVMIDFLIRHGCLGKVSHGNVLDKMNEMLRNHKIVNDLPHWSDMEQDEYHAEQDP